MFKRKRAQPFGETLQGKVVIANQYANIIGLRKGSIDEFILIGAHHDHLCTNSKNDAVFPGANDNEATINYAGMEKSFLFLVNLVKVVDENSPKKPLD